MAPTSSNMDSYKEAWAQRRSSGVYDWVGRQGDAQSPEFPCRPAADLWTLIRGRGASPATIRICAPGMAPMSGSEGWDPASALRAWPHGLKVRATPFLCQTTCGGPEGGGSLVEGESPHFSVSQTGLFGKGLEKRLHCADELDAARGRAREPSGLQAEL